MIDADQLNQLDAQQLREVVRSLMGTVTTQRLEIERRDREIACKPSINHALARGVGTDVRGVVYGEPSSMFQGSSAS